MKLLFVCTGNTCRSPMAEAIMNDMLIRAGRADIHAESAGISPGGADPASYNTLDALSELGITLAQGYTSRKADAAMLDSCDKVYCMTSFHAQILTQLYPQFAYKISLMPGGDIPDPFGGDIKEYRECRSIITSALRSIANELGVDYANPD